MADKIRRIHHATACGFAGIKQPLALQWASKGYLNFATADQCDERQLLELVLAARLQRYLKKEVFSRAMAHVRDELQHVRLESISVETMLVWDIQTGAIRLVERGSGLGLLLSNEHPHRVLAIGRDLVDARTSFRVETARLASRAQQRGRLKVVSGRDSDPENP